MDNNNKTLRDLDANAFAFIARAANMRTDDQIIDDILGKIAAVASKGKFRIEYSNNEQVLPKGVIEYLQNKGFQVQKIFMHYDISWFRV